MVDMCDHIILWRWTDQIRTVTAVFVPLLVSAMCCYYCRLGDEDPV
jgi:hypothetical protein